MLAKEDQARCKRDTIRLMAEELLANSIPIKSADSIVVRVNESTDLKVKHSEVRSVLRKDLGLGYRIARKIPIQSNSERCLVLRQ